MDESGYKIHVVGPADTIQAIGDVYGVDWTRIVIVNGLQYPYINTEPASGDNDIGEGVAVVGRALLIPTGDLLFPVRTYDGLLDVEQYILGSDLDIYSYMESDHNIIRIGESGELVDNMRGDLKLATGLRNLRQQLVTRLGTPKGTLLLHPEYGSDILTYIGKTITKELLINIKLCVQECFLKDSRVSGLSKLNVSAAGSVIQVDCIIHAIEPFGHFRLMADVTPSGAVLLDP